MSWNQTYLQGKPRNVHHLFCFRVLCRSELDSLNSLHRKMSSGLFFTFLDTGKFDMALKCIASDFQYDALHSERSTTLLVEVSAAGMCKLSAERLQCLELIKALRAGGASWTQPCRSKSSYSVWNKADPEKSKITVHYGNHSALSFAQKWLRELHHKKEWQEEVSYFHNVLEIYLVEAQLQPPLNKLAIAEDIVSKLRRSHVSSVVLDKSRPLGLAKLSLILPRSFAITHTGMIWLILFFHISLHMQMYFENVFGKTKDSQKSFASNSDEPGIEWRYREVPI